MEDGSLVPVDPEVTAGNEVAPDVLKYHDLSITTDAPKVKPFLERITTWFDAQMNRELTDVTEVVTQTNAASSVYEDMGVQVQSLESYLDELKLERSVNKKMRMSMESYVGVEDTLPDARTYTNSNSLVNYDATVAWVERKRDEKQFEQLQVAARFMVLSLKSIRGLAVEPSAEESQLQANIERAQVTEKRAMGYLSQASGDPDNNEAQLVQFLTDLSLPLDAIDYTMTNIWSDNIKRRRVLDLTVNPYLNGKLNGLVLALLEENTTSDEFAEYLKSVQQVTKKLIKAYEGIAKGVASTVDVSDLFGGMKRIESLYTRFNRLSLTQGTDTIVDIPLVNTILKNGAKLVKLSDSSDTVLSAKIEALDTALSNAYALGNPAEAVPVDIQTPFALLQAMEENQVIATVLIDSYQLIHETYHSLVSLAQSKNILMNAYYMYSTTLVD